MSAPVPLLERPNFDALRLTLARDGEEYRLVGAERLQTITSPRPIPPRGPTMVGSWAELSGANGLLYTFRAPDLRALTAEAVVVEGRRSAASDAVASALTRAAPALPRWEEIELIIPNDPAIVEIRIVIADPVASTPASDTPVAETVSKPVDLRGIF